MIRAEEIYQDIVVGEVIGTGWGETMEECANKKQ